MNEQLIRYCERTSHAFWAEPWNAVTNAAFLLAALFAWMHWRRNCRENGGADGPAAALIVIVAVTGTGSFLWHTFATRWAMLTDTIPIAIFIYTYFWFAMRRFLHLPALTATAMTLAFGLGSVAIQAWGKGTLNGSMGYLPALLAMTGVSAAMAFWHPVHASQIDPHLRMHTAKLVAAAGFLFSFSLFFRTIDREVCMQFAHGTHFLWHILNACVLYVLIRAMVDYRDGERPALKADD